MAKRVKPSMGCGYLLAFVLAGGGVVLATAAVNGWRVSNGNLAGKSIAQAVIGAGLIAGAFVYLGFARRMVAAYAGEEKQRAAFPDKPWMWKEEWRREWIPSKDGAGAGLFWLFAIIWNGASVAAVLAILGKRHHDRAEWLVVLFPLIGAGLLAAAIYKTIQLRKFGRTRLVLTTRPGSIGGHLGGVIEIPARVAVEHEARLALQCVRRVTSGSGKNRRTSETVVWEREERIAPEQWSTGPGRTEVPVLFHIPEGSPPTDTEGGDDRIVWRLGVRAPVPGVDFETSFEVPVFFTGETAAPPAPGESLLPEYRSGPPDSESLASAGVDRSPGAWRFGTNHLWGTRLVFTLIAAGLIGVLAALAGRGLPWIAFAVTGIFAGIFLLIALDLWTGGFELRLEGVDVVVVKRRPWGRREQRVPRAGIAAVDLEKSMTIGSTQYYRLILVGKRGADPRVPGSSEPFRLRKLRYQLRQAEKELGTGDPANLGERGRELMDQISRAPTFQATFAKHIPGESFARKVADQVMSDIAAKR